MTEADNDIHLAGDIAGSSPSSHWSPDDSLDVHSDESSDTLENEIFWNSQRLLWSPLPPLFATDFLNCSVCNSLSKGGILGTELDENNDLAIDSATRYTLATADVKVGSHNCPICSFLYGAVCSYASRFQDFHRTSISVVNGLCDHTVRISDDLGEVPNLKILVYYPQPNVQWFSCGLPVRKPVENILSVDKTIELILDWLSTCHKGHINCQHSQNATIQAECPGRLIDLRRLDEGIVTLTKAVGLDMSYVALSYCWGGVSKLTLISETMEVFTNGIQWSRLPLTMRQAMDLTRKLGIQYIWIDALCIQQDSLEDWRTESSKMGSIYANAYLVISADTAADIDSGFLSPRASDNHTVELVDSSSHRNTTKTLFLSEHDKRRKTDPLCEIHSLFLPNRPKRVSSEPVFNRAWCMQESLAATRVIHFTSCEMVWECRSETQCECHGLNSYNRNLACGRLNLKELRKQIYHNYQKEQFSKKDQVNFWYDIVRDYSHRNLSLDSDHLPAISAIAKGLQSSLLGCYLAGMWLGALPHALLWRCQTTSRAGKPLVTHRRSHNFVAPSWSWASVFGGVEHLFYPSDGEFDERVIAEVVDVSCETVSQESYGQVKRGVLVLEAALIPATLHCKPYSEESSASSRTVYLSLPGHTSTIESLCFPDVDWPQSGSSTDCFCVLVARIDLTSSITYLTLLIVPSSKHVGAFKRVGFAYVYHRQPFTSLEENRKVITMC